MEKITLFMKTLVLNDKGKDGKIAACCDVNQVTVGKGAQWSWATYFMPMTNR